MANGDQEANPWLAELGVGTAPEEDEDQEATEFDDQEDPKPVNPWLSELGVDVQEQAREEREQRRRDRDVFRRVISQDEIRAMRERVGGQQPVARTEERQREEDEGFFEQARRQIEERGAEMEREAEAFTEFTTDPETFEDARAVAGATGRDLARSATTGDALKGLLRGVVGFGTATGAGVLRSPEAVGELAGAAIEQVPGLEDFGEDVRQVTDFQTLEEGAAFLTRKRQESFDILGRPETVTGNVMEIGTRMGLELAEFVAAGQGLRAAAGKVGKIDDLGAIGRNFAKLENPSTFMRRLGEDLISGSVIDFMIGASGKDQATVGFLHDLAAENDKVREGLKNIGADPDEVEETLAWFNENNARRGTFEAIMGAALATPVIGAQSVLAGGRRAGGEAAEATADVQVRGSRFQVEETDEGARIVDTELDEPVTETVEEVDQVYTLARSMNAEEQAARQSVSVPEEAAPDEPGLLERAGERIRRTVGETLDLVPREQADRDFDTGLLNKQGEKRIRERRQPAPDAEEVELEADLDNFKAINDNLGHDAGDDAIRVIADAFREATRGQDEVVTISRRGGDEFRVTLELPEGQDPTPVARRIESHVNRKLQEAGYGEVNGTPVGVSVGVGEEGLRARKAERGVSIDREVREAREAAEGAEGEFTSSPEPFVDDTFLPRDAENRSLLHVTTAADAVRAEGLKPRAEVESVGLGGGVTDQASGRVSTTFDAGHAATIRNRMELAVRAARGEADVDEVIRHFENEIGSDTPRPMAEALNAPEETYDDWNAFSEWARQEFGTQTRGRRRIQNAYSLVQELDDEMPEIMSGIQGRPTRVGFTATREQMANIDPDQIETIRVEARQSADPEHIPDEAELRFAPGELRVPGRVTEPTARAATTPGEGPDLTAAREAAEKRRMPLEEVPEDLQTTSARNLKDKGYEAAARQKREQVESKVEDFFREGEVDTGSPSSARQAEEAATTSSEASAREEPVETRPEEPGEAGEEPSRRLEELGDREVGTEVPGITGAARTVKNADGSEVLTQYKVVEAADIETSHAPLEGFAPRADYPDVVQERRYHADDDAKSFVIENARELDPDQVLDGTTRPTDGPPIVTEDGIALGGNARSMMLKTAYARHPDRAQAYRDQLIGNLNRFGLSDQAQRIAGMENPVLVRQVSDQNVDPADRGTLAELASKFNDVPTRSRDPLGEASTRARRLLENESALRHYAETIDPEQTLRAYLRSSDGRRWLQLLTEEGTIKPQSATEFRLDDGTISDEGKIALERMMFAAVVDDPEVLARAPKSVLRDLTHAVPPLVKASKVEGFDLGPNIRNTLDYLHRFRNSDFDTLDEFASQTGMFEEASDRTKQLARFLEEENRSTIKSGFRKYAEDAVESARQDEANDLFGRDPVSDAEAFEKRFVDRVHEPEIPGLRGNPTGEEGFAAPELQNAIARTAGGFVFGSLAGSQFGSTPEQKLRNMLIFGAGGIAATEAGAFMLRRLRKFEWNFRSEAAGKIADNINKSSAADPDDPLGVRSHMREAYRQIFRRRLPIDESSQFAQGRLRGSMPSSRDPAIWRALLSGSVAHGDQSFHLGVHRPGTSDFRTERGLKAVIEEAGSEQDRLRIYGVARRIVEDLEPRGFFEPDEEQVEMGAEGIRQAVGDITPEDARRALKEEFGRTYKEGTTEVENVGDAKMNRLFEEVQRIDDAWYALMEEMNVLERGAADRIRGENPNYWPLQRDIPEGEQRAMDRGEQAVFQRGRATTAIEGSELPILDPLESLVIQQYRYSDLIFRQRVYETLAETAEVAPKDHPFLTRVGPEELGRRLELDSDRLSGLPDHIEAELADETIEAWVPRRVEEHAPVLKVTDPEGKPVYYKVEPDMADALEGMNPQQLSTWAKLMKPAARWLRTAVTAMPDFQAANLFRDSFFRAVTDPSVGADPDASFARQFAGGPKALAEVGEANVRALATLLSDELGIGSEDEILQMWKSAGGPFGAFQEMDRNVIAQRLREMQREGREIQDVVQHPISALRAIGDRIRAFEIAFENATRFGKFRGEVEGQTGDINTVLRAAAESRDVTIDFSLEGASRVVHDLRNVSSFWMARLQGLDKLRRAMVENPKKFFGTGLAAITVPSLALYAVNRNNPDYWKKPEWEKNVYWNLPLPNVKPDDIHGLFRGEQGERNLPEKVLKPFVQTGETVWLRLPKPFEPGWIFGSMPVRFLEQFDTANPFQDETIAERVKTAAGDIGPEFWQMIQDAVLPIPTAAKPWIENFFNYDFFLDRAVVNPYDAQRKIDPRLKGRDQATRFARNVGDAIGQPAPTVDNVVNDYFGGAGRAATGIIDWLGRPERHGPRPEQRIGEKDPIGVMSRFIRESDRFSPKSVTEFYNLWNKADGAYQSYQDWMERGRTKVEKMRGQGANVTLNETPEISRAQNIFRENLEAVLKRDVLQDIANELSLIRDARDRINNDPDLTAQQKREALDQLRGMAGFATSLATFKPEARRDLLERHTVPAKYEKWAQELQKADEIVRRIRSGRQDTLPDQP